MNLQQEPIGFSFDTNGPRLGPIRLLNNTRLGFFARDEKELSTIFSTSAAMRVDCRKLADELATIARALNEGKIGLAAVAASRLRLPDLTEDQLRAAADADDLLKAGVDDEKHPGYPAGTPDGKGGEFRPKDAGGDGSPPPEKAERLKRLASRRTFRSIATRVLSTKRILKMVGRWVEGEIAEEIPVVNDIVGAASLKDDIDLMIDIGQDVADSDAAIDFVNKGPFDLGDLQQSPNTPQSFRSFDAFKKIEIEKQYGPAGDGYDYHHIVEQGPNAGTFTQEQLQSTENIVRIPRLLHEELNSYYGSSVDLLNGELTTPRLFLRGRSFEEQRTFGIQQLRKIGVIH